MASGEGKMIWLRDEPSARSPAHTRAEIVTAALAIADSEGFEAVSMRRVAQRLGAGTMTLYHYVESKSELVTLMVDAVLGEIQIPKQELARDWRPALRQIAIRTRDAFRRHRWALDRVDEARPAPNGLRNFEQAMGACAELGLSPEEKFELTSFVADYVFGFVLRETREEEDQHRGWDPEVLEFFQRQLESGEYPEFQLLIGGDVETGFERAGELFLGEGRFERGLDRLLDGIEADLESDG